MTDMPLPRLPLAIGAAAFAVTMGFAVPSDAHEAKSGWMYPVECCSNRDCREVAAELISERPEGYLIRLTGEQIAYSDSRIRHSPDGVYHRCSAQGRDDTRTICLFVPPNSF